MTIKKIGSIPVFEFSCLWCESAWEADVTECDESVVIMGISCARMTCPVCGFGKPIGERKGVFIPVDKAANAKITKKE